MPGAVHHLHRLVAADRHPGDAGRAQIMEGDLLPRRVVGEELRARHAGPLEVLAKSRREIAQRGHREQPRRCGTLADDDLHQAHDLRLHRESPRVVGFVSFSSSSARSMDGSVDVKHAVYRVDVVDAERFQLARAAVAIDVDGDQPSPTNGNAQAPHQREELRRVRVGSGSICFAIDRNYWAKMVKKTHYRALLAWKAITVSD